MTLNSSQNSDIIEDKPSKRLLVQNQSQQDQDLVNFSFYLDDSEQDKIFAFFKFSASDLINKNEWNQIKEVLSSNINGTNDNSMPIDESQIKQPKIFTFTILNYIEVKVTFSADVLFVRDKSFSLICSYQIKILDHHNFDKNGILYINTRGYNSNLREGLCRKKYRFYLSYQEQTLYINIQSKLYPDKQDQILWEIRFEPEGFHQIQETLPIGLTNLGVTCYMNSFLQTIFFLKSFRQFVLNMENENKQDSFLFNLQSLFYLMDHIKTIPVSTQNLVKSFKWDVTQVFTQQDVQEFSFMFMEAIEQKSKQLGIDEKIMKEMFEGKMECFIKCNNVHYQSIREEIFTDVQLIVKQNNNLYKALDDLFKSELLENENAYQTDDYGKQDAIKGQKFKELPPVLVFQLNRFAYDYQFDENVKINDFFEFYEEIDLNEYIKQSDKTQYELLAVYVHIGLRGNSGHYKVFIKVDEKWLEFNDEIVEEVNFDHVKKNSFGGKTKDIVLDIRNFCIKFKKRDSSGHAYRLVYIQKAQKNKILKNGGQPIQYPQNIITYNEQQIQEMKKDHFKRTHFSFIFTNRNSFINQKSGPGTLFYQEFFKDNKYKHIKQNKIYKKIIMPKQVNEMNFYKQLNEEFQIKEDETIYLFIFDDKYNQFQLFNFKFFEDSLDTERKWYFYYDIQKVILNNPILLIIKSFDPNSEMLKVEEIAVVDGSSFMIKDVVNLYQNIYPDASNYQISYLRSKRELEELMSMPDTTLANSIVDTDEAIFIVLKSINMDAQDQYHELVSKVHKRIMGKCFHNGETKEIIFQIDNNPNYTIFDVIKKSFNVNKDVLLKLTLRNNNNYYTFNEGIHSGTNLQFIQKLYHCSQDILVETYKPDNQVKVYIYTFEGKVCCKEMIDKDNENELNIESLKERIKDIFIEDENFKNFLDVIEESDFNLKNFSIVIEDLNGSKNDLEYSDKIINLEEVASFHVSFEFIIENEDREYWQFLVQFYFPSIQKHFVMTLFIGDMIIENVIEIIKNFSLNFDVNGITKQNKTDEEIINALKIFCLNKSNQDLFEDLDFVQKNVSDQFPNSRINIGVQWSFNNAYSSAQNLKINI